MSFGSCNERNSKIMELVRKDEGMMCIENEGVDMV
jgi:hypothetical protein